MKASITFHDLSTVQIAKLTAFVNTRSFGDDEAVNPEDTFANTAPAAPQLSGSGNTYGFGQAPLPPEATPALSSAVVAPSPIAPAAPPVSSIAPLSVPPVPAPLPAPPVVAPTEPAAPSSLAANVAVELDAKGLPWDGRIHTGTKTKNQDGTWRQKRGTDDALVAAVEAELRAAMGVGRPAGVPAAPAAPSGVPVAPAPAAAQHAELTGDASADFATIMDRLMKLVAAGKTDQAGVTALIGKHGVASVGHLSLNASVYPALLTEIKALAA